jgi:hypothetical protein
MAPAARLEVFCTAFPEQADRLEHLERLARETEQPLLSDKSFPPRRPMGPERSLVFRSMFLRPTPFSLALQSLDHTRFPLPLNSSIAAVNQHHHDNHRTVYDLTRRVGDLHHGQDALQQGD